MAKQKGTLFPYFETGTEGLIWTVLKEGKDQDFYSRMILIEKGDHLKIFDEQGGIIFQGIIEPNYKCGWKEYPLNPDSGLGQPCALGFWIHWTQNMWQPDDWARLFLLGNDFLPEEEDGKSLRAEIIKKTKGFRHYRSRTA